MIITTIVMLAINNVLHVHFYAHWLYVEEDIQLNRSSRNCNQNAFIHKWKKKTIVMDSVAFWEEEGEEECDMLTWGHSMTSA